MTNSAIDEERATQFAGQLLGMYNGGMLSLMVDVGLRSGLFEAAAQGPATSEELASRVGLSERHVREWLGAMVSGKIFEYEAEVGRYTLPPEHAVSLTGRGSSNIGALSQFVALLGTHVEEVSETFKSGGGVPYSSYRPAFTTVMDAGSRVRFDELLLDGYLGAAPDLQGRLTAGAAVADIGCGTGHSTNVMAQAFPGSRFVGYDIADDALTAARAEAEAMSLSNVRFENQDVAQLASDANFDLITVFDAVHDQADPASVLAGVSRAVGKDGTFLMIDVHASSSLEDNVNHPMAPLIYSISTLHCMQVSLAEDGVGLGAAWGEQLAVRMLKDAGFRRIDISQVDGDPLNSVYVCRK